MLTSSKEDLLLWFLREHSTDTDQNLLTTASLGGSTVGSATLTNCAVETMEPCR